MKYKNFRCDMINKIRPSVKSLFFVISLMMIVFTTSCDREKLDELYTSYGANNDTLVGLENVLKNINSQIEAQKTLAHQLKSSVTLAKEPEVTTAGVKLTFTNGTTETVVNIAQGKTPVVTINPTTKKWVIDGVPTPYDAIAVNGTIPVGPEVEIRADQWWMKTNGVWANTGLTAAAAKGPIGEAPTLSLVDGKWKFSYTDGTAAVTSQFVAGATDAIAPVVDTVIVGGKVYWATSVKGAKKETTGILVSPAKGDKGDKGIDGINIGVYIKSISMIGKEVTFTFEDGTTKVVMLNNGLEFAITGVTNDLVEVGFNTNVTINYTLNTQTTAYIDQYGMPKGWQTRVDKTAKTIKITAPADLALPTTMVGGNVAITASDDKGNFVTKYLTVKIKEGSIFNGQVICWVNLTSNAAPRIKTIHNNNIASLAWQTTPTYLGVADVNNGKINTQSVVNAGVTGYPAFQAATALGGYIPAVGELKELFANSAVLSAVNAGLTANGGTTLGEARYWSSTELTRTSAFVVTSTGANVSADKTTLNATRVFFSY